MGREGEDGEGGREVGKEVVSSGVLGCITSSVSIPSGDGAGGVVSTGGPHVFLPPGGCGRPTQPRHSHLRAGCWTSSSQGTGLWAGQSGRGVLEVSCYCLRLSRSRGGAPPIAGEAHNSQCVRGAVRSCTGCVAIPRLALPPGSSCPCWSTLSCSCCHRALAAWHTHALPWRRGGGSCWLGSWPVNW